MAYTTVNDSSANFQIALYTGNSGTQSITNDGNANLKPDLTWIKQRDGTGWPSLFDSSRGVEKQINSNVDNSQYTGVTGVTSFNTDGFTLGSHSNENFNTKPYVCWQWKANGGTTASNSDGSITSTVQANTTAGFSIVTWTGTTSNGTVGHGLGKAPDCIFFKNYAAAENWTTYHSVLGNSGGLYLNLTNAFNTASSWYSDTSPTSNYFYVGTNTKTNGGSMIAYCFADTPGYSKFGKYTGNGDTDGSFVYTGFKPACVIFKKTNATKDWYILDNKRNSFNVMDKILHPNKSDVESTSTIFDFLSNGFKFRNGDNAWNGNGDTYVYLAFAQNPLVATNDVIALAR